MVMMILRFDELRHNEQRFRVYMYLPHNSARTGTP